MSYADRIARMQGELLVKYHFDNPTNKIERPIPRAGTNVTMRIGQGPRIVNGKISDWDQILTGTAATQSGLTNINISSITDVGFGPTGLLDDGLVPLTIGAPFNFFGTTSNISWSSNNALVFGTVNIVKTVNISATTCPAILIGNYERTLTSIKTSTSITEGFAITTIVPTFVNYFTDYIGPTPTALFVYNPDVPTYSFQIRLIKERVGSQRQYVEVLVISSPPSPGYSSAITTYPSGPNANGNPQDSNGDPIDQTKRSPYNITNGTTFLNPCGSTFSLTSPPAGTSFVFSSDATGSTWTFTNNARVNT